jgi:hypothetical protein
MRYNVLMKWLYHKEMKEFVVGGLEPIADAGAVDLWKFEFDMMMMTTLAATAVVVVAVG